MGAELNVMLSIDRQAEKIRQRDRLIHKLYLLVITLSSIIIILAAMIYAMTRTAAAAETVCLTKKEARQLWPRKHLYWYSKDHCWSDRRGGPSRNLRIDPVLKTHAELLPAPVYDVLPRPRPKIVQQPDPPDDCCWPPLDQLQTEEKEAPLRWLADKLNQK